LAKASNFKKKFICNLLYKAGDGGEKRGAVRFYLVFTNIRMVFALQFISIF